MQLRWGVAELRTQACPRADRSCRGCSRWHIQRVHHVSETASLTIVAKGDNIISSPLPKARHMGVEQANKFMKKADCMQYATKMK